MSIKEVALERELRYRLGSENYNAWFRGLEFDRIEGERVHFTIATNFQAAWINSHFRDELEIAVRHAYSLDGYQLRCRYPSRHRQERVL